MSMQTIKSFTSTVEQNLSQITCSFELVYRFDNGPTMSSLSSGAHHEEFSRRPRRGACR